MAITKEVLDELLKEYRGPEDITGPEGLLKQLTKALIERAMEAELTEHVGYEKHDQSEKQTENRRNGKTKKTLRTDQGQITRYSILDWGTFEAGAAGGKGSRLFVADYDFLKYVLPI